MVHISPNCLSLRLTISARRFYRRRLRQRFPTSCRRRWERVLIYEIRVYEAAEGKADAMRRRFCDNVATQFFPRHGIELVGVFAATVEDGRLTYMTRFVDEACH